MSNVKTILVNAPFGATDKQTVAATSSTQTFTIKDNNTILATSTAIGTATAAIAISASSELVAGATLNFILGASTNSTITLSGDVYSGTLSVSSGKIGSISYFYDGDKFYPCGTLVNY